MVEHRSPKPAVVGSSPSAPANLSEDFLGNMVTEKGKTSWLTFLRQVRLEAARVIWPSRQEVVTTTVFVFIMVALFALFFLAVDSVMSSAVYWLIR